MKSIETLLDMHTNEMAELRQRITTTRKSLKQARRDEAQSLKELKRKYRIQPPPEPKSPPLAFRVFSFLFL